MEETDRAKEWFVTHEGKQFGPVSMDDLKFEVERGELNPRLDMVWKNGMEDWIPAGELDGLFEKNDESKAAGAAAKQASGTFTGYTPMETEEERKRIKGNWPGVGRGTYFFVCFIFPIIFGLGTGAFSAAIRGRIEPSMFELISNGLLLLLVIIIVIVTLKRFQNLAMSRWWYIPLNIPPLTFWLQYRLFACPPGYAQNKKLDGLGWFLAIIYWLLTLAIAAAIAAFIYFSTINPDKLKEMLPEKEAQEFIEFMEKARERGEKLRAPGESAEPSTEPGTTE